MIVVRRIEKPRYHRGGTLLIKKPKYQYGGYGIVSTGKKFMIDNIKKLINSVN